jgi:hypothetical protein
MVFTICAVALYQQKMAKISAPHPAIFNGVSGGPNTPIIPKPSIVNVIPISASPPKSNREIRHAEGKSKKSVIPALSQAPQRTICKLFRIITTSWECR